jgi:hypothetical protein
LLCSAKMNRPRQFAPEEWREQAEWEALHPPAPWQRALIALQEGLIVFVRLPMFWALIFVTTPTFFVYSSMARKWMPASTPAALVRAFREKPIRLLIWAAILFCSIAAFCLCFFGLDLALWFGLWVCHVTGLPAVWGLVPGTVYLGTVLYVYIAIFKGSF